MKKVGILITLFVLLVTVSATQAEVKAGSVSVTPFVGGYFFERNQDQKDAAIYGLRAGYNFTQNWAMEGFFGYMKTQIQDPSAWSPWQDIYSYGIEGLYHFMPNGRIVPFIALGVGGTYYSRGYTYPYSDTYGDRFIAHRFTIDYGAGLKFFITDSIALRADVRHVLPRNDNYNDFLCTLGINFAFGGTKAVAEAKVEETPMPVVPEQKIAPPPAPMVPENKVEAPPVTQRVAPPAVQYAAPEVVEKIPQRISFILRAKFVGKDKIDKRNDKYIRKLADFMKEHPETSIEIIGHTYNSGNEGYDILLTQKRADNVRSYLIHEFGIKAFRIEAFGYGSSLPIAAGRTKEAKLQNQRIEVVIKGLQATAAPSSMQRAASPRPEPENVAPAEPEKTPEKVSFILNVHFEDSKAVIKKKYHHSMEKLANFMIAHPETRIVIIGHTDKDGKAGKLLSKKWADSVRKYLQDNFDIERSRMAAFGLGASEPIADNKTKKGREMNRRIEIVIKGLQTK